MKDAKGHGSEPRGSGGAMPIAGHPYHTKTNDELHYITKDASEAARAQRGMSSEGKYLDQVNDASTVLGYRARGGRDLSQSPATAVAAQHGIGTSHLNPPVNPRGTGVQFGHGPTTNRWTKTNGDFRRSIK